MTQGLESASSIQGHEKDFFRADCNSTLVFLCRCRNKVVCRTAHVAVLMSGRSTLAFLSGLALKLLKPNDPHYAYFLKPNPKALRLPKSKSRTPFCV